MKNKFLLIVGFLSAYFIASIYNTASKNAAIIKAAESQETAPIRQAPAVTTKPPQVEPTVVPSPTPTPTPTPTPKPKFDVEIGKPEITEELEGAGGNQGYSLKRTETRKFRTPEGKTKTITKVVDKTVSYGFIETKTNTTTDINGFLSKRAETKTETEDGITTETKNTNEWGMTTTEKIESNEVSNELKNTLTLNTRSAKADPEIQPEPEPEPTVASENYSTADSGNYGGTGYYEYSKPRRRRR